MSAPGKDAAGAGSARAAGSARPLAARPPGAGLRGELSIPGDKSISHRALIFGALAVGRTEITGLLEGEDVLRTAAAMRALGARVTRTGPGAWQVDGLGVGGLMEPDDILDFGNAGTGVRLCMGLVAGHPITAFFTGDASLRRRPMGRVLDPLMAFGAEVFAGARGLRLPLGLRGAEAPRPADITLTVPSAQVKSAILLAGLAAPGITSLVEPVPTRDHTERLLRHFGAELDIQPLPRGGHRIALRGQPELRPARVAVPGDPSSAAFPLVAALLVPGSELRLRHVLVNPGRIGLLTTLTEMGADITLVNPREEGGEPVADLVVRASRLRGVPVPAERAPSMIDEYPILAIAAALAEGETRMEGLGELRVKESDRLAVMETGLRAAGVSVEAGPDSLTVRGTGPAGRPRGGARIATHLDHRIAMSFLVLGLVSEAGMEVDDGTMIATSFPGFEGLMREVGAEIGGLT
ncbi:MAG: 3-phosphoshikimate 1-carboxyvinyltransferase [Alphaproteobacteria bacterium]|nr:3-phosphoshikimate 1-carboxyvinyltransferase [Alphaproteobacteria bacterium]